MLTERYTAAINYVRTLHATQVRKATGAPYISHLLSVSGLVLSNGGSEDEAIAALLHDAAEDQGATHADIAKRFGAAVADMVVGLTEPGTDQLPKLPWSQRKRAYVGHFSVAPYGVLLVAACDKLDNIRSLAIETRTRADAWALFKQAPPVNIGFYAAVADAILARAPNTQAAAVARQVLEIAADMARTLGLTLDDVRDAFLVEISLLDVAGDDLLNDDEIAAARAILRAGVAAARLEVARMGITIHPIIAEARRVARAR